MDERGKSRKFGGTERCKSRQITVGRGEEVLANKTEPFLGSPIKSTTVYNESPKTARATRGEITLWNFSLDNCPSPSPPPFVSLSLAATRLNFGILSSNWKRTAKFAGSPRSFNFLLSILRIEDVDAIFYLFFFLNFLFLPLKSRDNPLSRKLILPTNWYESDGTRTSSRRWVTVSHGTHKVHGQARVCLSVSLLESTGFIIDR